MERFFYFLPRVLAIVVTAFLAIFAIDVVAPGRSILLMIGLFFVHLFPNYLLIFALLIAWRKEFYGGLAFLIIGAFFTYFYETYVILGNFFIVSFPVFLVGFLFLVHAIFFRKTTKNIPAQS